MSVNSPAHMRAFAMAMMATITFSIGALGGFSSGFVAEYKGYQFSFSLSAGLAIGAGLLIMGSLWHSITEEYLQYYCLQK